MISIRKIEIAHHPSNDGQLLEILFSENSRVRRKEMKQFRHHRADSFEMSGTRPSAERLRKRFFLDDHRAIRKIHFGRFRAEQHVDSRRTAKLFIRSFWTRIFFEIRAGLELQWIHEDADRYLTVRARRFSRGPDQFQMPAMQSAHRWN